MKILGIDTSTAFAGVGLYVNGDVSTEFVAVAAQSRA